MELKQLHTQIARVSYNWFNRTFMELKREEEEEEEEKWFNRTFMELKHAT